MKRGMEMSTSPQGKTKTIYRTISAKNILKIFEAEFEKKLRILSQDGQKSPFL